MTLMASLRTMATRSHSNTSGLTPWVGTMVHCATSRTRKINTTMVFIEDCLVEFLLMLGEICLQQSKVSATTPESVLCEDAFFNPSQGTVDAEPDA
ncbi:hypothetical protein D5086_011994 [Populus alba]|uniref:Uncharacterized protein n=1 Tax=Populus alba TaxID=43335 RepID=A0ACC4C1M6_POPAL